MPENKDRHALRERIRRKIRREHPDWTAERIHEDLLAQLGGSRGKAHGSRSRKNDRERPQPVRVRTEPYLESRSIHASYALDKGQFVLYQRTGDGKLHYMAQPQTYDPVKLGNLTLTFGTHYSKKLNQKRSPAVQREIRQFTDSLSELDLTGLEYSIVADQIKAVLAAVIRDRAWKKKEGSQ